MAAPPMLQAQLSRRRESSQPPQLPSTRWN
nr:MAG TPA: hypothetical protein [Caudoviricetes sp.]